MKRDWLDRLKEGYEHQSKMREELTDRVDEVLEGWEKTAIEAKQNGDNLADAACSINAGLNIVQLEQSKNTIAIDTLNVVLIEIFNALRDIHQLLEERKDTENETR